MYRTGSFKFYYKCLSIAWLFYARTYSHSFSAVKNEIKNKKRAKAVNKQGVSYTAGRRPPSHSLSLASLGEGRESGFQLRPSLAVTIGESIILGKPQIPDQQNGLITD